MLKQVLIAGVVLTAAAAGAQAQAASSAAKPLAADQIAFKQLGEIQQRCSAEKLGEAVSFPVQCEASGGVLKNCQATAAPAHASLAAASVYAQCAGAYIHLTPGVSGQVSLNLQTPE